MKKYRDSCLFFHISFDFLADDFLLLRSIDSMSSCKKLFYESIDGLGLRVHKETVGTWDDVVAEAVGKMFGKPASFGFGGEYIVGAVDE